MRLLEHTKWRLTPKYRKTETEVERFYSKIREGVQREGKYNRITGIMKTRCAVPKWGKAEAEEK